MNRDELKAQVSAQLGNRRLVWSGVRGDDIEPLADLHQLYASYSITARYAHREGIQSIAHEDLTGIRPDLETYDIDDHLAEETARRFRRAHLIALSEPSALLPYRSSQFLSSIWFARQDRCLQLGLFGGHEAAFEHKPWVESSLRDLGVATVPWVYIADEEQLATHRIMAGGPIVLRRSRTSGGEGFSLIDDPRQLAEEWPNVPEAFVSVAPHLFDTTPLNVGAVVWRDGVTVHYPSVQLIGIPECVTRPFGYCGNDFAAMAALPRSIVDELEVKTKTIGHWLRTYGYLGTFGVDYLIHDGQLLFMEINPRFQGSTHASCRLSVAVDESCLLLEHIAAFLGFSMPPARPLRERVAEADALAHIVVHWTGAEAAALDPTGLADAVRSHQNGIATEVMTKPELLTEPGAAVARLIVRESITDTGFRLTAGWSDLIGQWQRRSQGDVVRTSRMERGLA